MTDPQGPPEATVEDLERLRAETDELLQIASRNERTAVSNFELLVCRVQALIDLALPALPDRRRLAYELRYQRLIQAQIKAKAEALQVAATSPKLHVVEGVGDAARATTKLVNPGG